MELFLNSGWALVAIASLCLWMPLGRRTAADRRLSFIALVMLIVTLFPIISVSDDLWCLHNPAETDTCQRRDYGASCPHSIFPVATLPESAVAAPAVGFQRLAVQPYTPPQLAANPALTPIQNRPPPSA